MSRSSLQPKLPCRLSLRGLGIAALLWTGALAGATAAALAPAEQQALVERHNHWRAQVGVPALRWSDELARSSAQWAARLGRGGQCDMTHSGREDVGENLYWASPLSSSDGDDTVQDIAASEVVDSWGEESKDYSYARNRCRAGQVCGHYTQLVWKDTREVGCARQVCSDRAQVWVCQYRPAGNYVGERPY